MIVPLENPDEIANAKGKLEEKGQVSNFYIVITNILLASTYQISFNSVSKNFQKEGLLNSIDNKVTFPLGVIWSSILPNRNCKNIFSNVQLLNKDFWNVLSFRLLGLFSLTSQNCWFQEQHVWFQKLLLIHFTPNTNSWQGLSFLAEVIAQHCHKEGQNRNEYSN